MGTRQNPQQLRSEAQKLLNEADRLEKQDKTDPLILLADKIHKETCTLSHVDMCGYEYEKDDEFLKIGTTKNRYYKMAVKLFKWFEDNGHPLEQSPKTVEKLGKLIKIISGF